MKTIVLYDSQFGNTRIIAEKIAQSVNAKTYNIQYFKIEQFKDVSLIIIGCPIQGWRPTKHTTVFLNSLRPNSLKGKNVASFDTRIHIFFSGDAANKINCRLINLGGKSIISPNSFFVKTFEGPLLEGELEKAETWAKHIIKNIYNTY